MSAQYVRDYYNVPAKRGMRVTVDGRSGVITGFRNQYILVRFDLYPRSGTWACHPTWRVTYHLPDGQEDRRGYE